MNCIISTVQPLRYLLGIHRRYGWPHQPLQIPQVHTWYPQEIWVASPDLAIHRRSISPLGNLAGLIAHGQSIKYLLGIHMRYGWHHQ